MKKKLIAITVVIAMTLTWIVDVAAIEQWSYSEDLTVYVNGEKVDNGAYKPIIVNDRTLVRLVPIFEALGYSSTDGAAEAGYYSYTEADKSISLIKNGTNATYTFIAESPYAIIGTGEGDLYSLEVPATLEYFDVFYIPIRAFCEMTNLNITWDDATRTVYISGEIGGTSATNTVVIDSNSSDSHSASLLTYEEAKAIGEAYVNDPDILLGGDTELITHNGRPAYQFTLRSKSMLGNGGSGTLGETLYVYADNGETDGSIGVNISNVQTANTSIIGNYRAYTNDDAREGIAGLEITEVESDKIRITYTRRHGHEFDIGNVSAYLQTDGTYVAEGEDRRYTLTPVGADSILFKITIGSDVVEELTFIRL